MKPNPLKVIIEVPGESKEELDRRVEEAHEAGATMVVVFPPKASSEYPEE